MASDNRASAQDVLLEAKALLAAEPVSEEEEALARAASAAIMPRRREFDDSEAKIVAGRLWLISFTDLFSIMLCFFLLIFATSDIDLKNLHEDAPPPPKGFIGDERNGNNIANVEYGEALNLDYLTGVLKGLIAQVKLTDAVRIVAGRDHLKLKIDADAAFIDDNTLNAAGLKTAKDLGESLTNLRNRVIVVVPGTSWQSDMARAATFADAMRNGGYRKSLAVLAEGAGSGDAIEVRVEADDGRIR